MNNLKKAFKLSLFISLTFLFTIFTSCQGDPENTASLNFDLSGLAQILKNETETTDTTGTTEPAAEQDADAGSGYTYELAISIHEKIDEEAEHFDREKEFFHAFQTVSASSIEELCEKTVTFSNLKPGLNICIMIQLTLNTNSEDSNQKPVLYKGYKDITLDYGINDAHVSLTKQNGSLDVVIVSEFKIYAYYGAFNASKDNLGLIKLNLNKKYFGFSDEYFDPLELNEIQDGMIHSVSNDGTRTQSNSICFMAYSPSFNQTYVDTENADQYTYQWLINNKKVTLSSGNYGAIDIASDYNLVNGLNILKLIVYKGSEIKTDEFSFTIQD
ncbi:MAG: hypothetical protein IIT58_04180 [Treponema sp.]|nr:hypothetical protein [Treponema sp.]